MHMAHPHSRDSPKCLHTQPTGFDPQHHLPQPTTMVCEDKRRIIAYLWYLNALLSIAYVIVAICAAANQKDVSATYRPAADRLHG